MGYLVCDRCGGYYELQEGEHPEDFSLECQCGGYLRYVESLDEDELDESGETWYCPSCGRGIRAGSKSCKFCGQQFLLDEPKPKSRKKFIAISIILLIIAGFIFIGYEYSMAKANNLTVGETKILLLCVDPSENRSGIGGVDMAFVLYAENGQLSKVKPIYPRNMIHPTAVPPEDLKQHLINCGAKPGYNLHDSLWTSDTKAGTKIAQEIVEYKTGIKTDLVVVITPQAVDALIKSVGPVYVPGQGYVNGNSIEFLRDEQEEGMSRGNAVESLMNSIKKAIQNRSKRSSLVTAASIQYIQGNIVVVPWDAFIQYVVGYWIATIF